MTKQSAPRIALIVDNPRRDLPGIVLVAMRLCAYGVKCFLVPFNKRKSELANLQVDYALVNYLRTNNSDFVRELLDKNIKVGVLNTEGAVFSQLPVTAHPLLHQQRQRKAGSKEENGANADSVALMMPQDETLRYRIDSVCCWGKAFSEQAENEGWFQRSQLEVTGTPRFDFYAHPWNEAVLKVSRYVEDYAKPLVLFASNSAIANPKFSSAASEAESLVRFGYTREFVEVWQQADAQMLKELAALANRVARYFPRVSIIYRPHPFESLETYRNLLDPLPNLHLVNQGTLDGWILRSSAIIHCNSTSAAEARLAGVPVLSPTWLSNRPRSPLADGVSDLISSPEELIERLSHIIAGTYYPAAEERAKQTQLISDWFHQLDGRSHQRVAQRIMQDLQYKNDNAIPSDHYRTTPKSVGSSDPPQKLQFRKRCMSLLNKSIALLSRPFQRLTKQVHTIKKPRKQVKKPRKQEAWLTSDKFFDAQAVCQLSTELHRCSLGDAAFRLPDVHVALARDCDEYQSSHHGHSVCIHPAETFAKQSLAATP